MAQCEWRKAGYPKSTLVRKAQTWVGTDRQCRGVIVQALRDNKTQTQLQLNKLWHDDSQLEKTLKTLIADGLIEPHINSFRLPH
jgi:A/G-specific adenine glycosylase